MTEDEQNRYIRREKRKCEKKNSHPNAESAKASGRRQITRGKIGALWWYQCRLCGQFHLTRSDHGPDYAIHFVLSVARQAG